MELLCFPNCVQGTTFAVGVGIMPRSWLHRVSQSINDWATNEFRNSVRTLRRSLVIAVIGSLVIVVGAILFRAFVKEPSITQHVVDYGEQHPKIVSRLGKEPRENKVNTFRSDGRSLGHAGCNNHRTDP